MIGIDRLFKKVNYFNNHYVYYIEIGTRPYLSGESNGIDINTTEYADVINNKFDIVVNPVTDIILVFFEEGE